jgi:hypothetical protein
VTKFESLGLKKLKVGEGRTQSSPDHAAEVPFLSRYSHPRSASATSISSQESGFFPQPLLSLVPEERAKDVVYFAPGDADNTLSFNPLSLQAGEDPILAAEDLFSILKES